jgi:hypothetical protein
VWFHPPRPDRPHMDWISWHRCHDHLHEACLSRPGNHQLTDSSPPSTRPPFPESRAGGDPKTLGGSR